ncbi:hypothetical protein WJX74_007025 [Apatococcus lobatus]|uniref:Structural maintenance of chromosomes protein n=1 Tax=Apatococcus lobatus TaxID=904363 RepID=A0AAW1RAY8_9CHLO
MPFARSDPCPDHSDLVRSAPCLQELELSGFKSYAQSVSIGPFTSRLTCIVGSNGTGKSVIGQALAFVLGGQCSLPHLQEGLSAKCLTAAGCRIAMVKAGLRLQDGQSMKICRSVSGHHETLEVQMQADELKKCSQAHLQQLLGDIPCCPAELSRSIVFQSRQSIAVQHPKELGAHLQLLTGSHAFQLRLADVRRCIHLLAGQLMSLTDEQASLLADRQKLAPEIARWKAWEADMNRHHLRQSRLLRLRLTEQESSIKTISPQVAKQRKVHRKAAALLKTISDAAAVHKAELSKHQKTEHKMILHIKGIEQQLAQVQAKEGRLMAQIKAMQRRRSQTRSRLQAVSTADNTTEAEHLRCSLQQRQADLSSCEAACKQAETNVQQLCAKGSENVLQARRLQLELKALEAQHTAAAHHSEMRAAAQAKQHEELSALQCQELQMKEQAAIEHDRLQAAYKQKQGILESVRKLKDDQRAIEDQISHLTAIQQELRDESRVMADASTTKAHRKQSSLEQAVRTLTLASQAGQLPGVLYGRLHSVIRLKSISSAEPVNSVLHEICRMASCLIVEDRQTAQAVVAYFQEHSIGIVTCKIASEMRAAAGSQKRNGLQGSVPLLSLLEMVPAAEAAACVITRMLQNWFLVPDAAGAEKLLRQTKQDSHYTGSNFVTSLGEIFKADGEVICGMASSVSPAFNICVDTSVPGKVAPERAQGWSQDCQKRANDIDQRLHTLSKQLAQLQEQLKACNDSIHQQNISLAGCQQQCQDSRKHQDEHKQKASMAAHEQRSLQAALDSATDEDLEGMKSTLSQKQKELHDICSSSSEGRALLKAQSAAAESDHALVALKADIAARQKSLRDAERKQAAVTRQTQELEALQTGLANLEGQHNEAHQLIGTKAAEVSELSLQLHKKQARTKSAAAGQQAHDRKLERAQAAEQQQMKTLHNFQQSLAAFMAAAETSKQKLKAAEGHLGSKDAVVSTDPGDSNEDDEYDENDDLEAALEELEEASEQLQARMKQIDTAALRADMEAMQRSAQVTKELQSAQEEIAIQQSLAESLEVQQYSCFHEAMQLVNARLTQVYQQLSGQDADAICMYAEDKALAFSQGVTVNVRPAGQRWRSFGMLSGGQQALATLSLSFALQAAFPSPFYFFDEIDSAMDTAAVTRVADYLCKQQLSSQYIVVTHKQQMYARAPCLLGVYTAFKSSATVMLHSAQDSEHEARGNETRMAEV